MAGELCALLCWAGSCQPPQTPPFALPLFASPTRAHNSQKGGHGEPEPAVGAR